MMDILVLVVIVKEGEMGPGRSMTLFGINKSKQNESPHNNMVGLVLMHHSMNSWLRCINWFVKMM